MPRIAIADVVKEVCAAPTPDDKVALLKKYDHPALQTFLKMMFDDSIKWALPEGSPPFTPNPYTDQEGALYSEIRRLYMFMEGGHPNLKQLKRETLFLNVLESIAPQDAALLLDVKDRKRPEGMPIAVVKQAFPHLFPGSQKGG